MPKFDIENAQASNYSGITEYSISPQNTDGVNDSGETRWQNTKWQQDWAYFNTIPELQSAVLMKAVWDVGKGYTTTPGNEAILSRISGWGKDSFHDIMLNMDIIAMLNGDSYAEIIRDEDRGTLLNIKPLDPASVVTIVNPNGRIKEYEQVAKIKGRPSKTIPIERMFHLSRYRLADQIHGLSVVRALEKTLLAEAESFDDLKKLMHFQVKPFIIFKMKTDDQTKIQNFVTKVQNARKLGEDMFIPDDENMLTYEVVQVNPSTLLLEWRTNLQNKFYRAMGLPLILFGSAGTTESGGKIEYTAHEQVWAWGQKYLELQIKNQLGIDLTFNSPTTLLDNLKADEGKDAQNALTFQQNDLTNGSGR